MATVLGHLIRCLYFWPDEGFKASGTCKASWVAEVFGISLRSAKSARSELEELGWLIRGASSQRRMNAFGPVVTINLDWARPMEAAEPRFAPPPPHGCTGFAPPLKNQDPPPGGDKNQDPPPGGRTGVSISNEKKELPTLRDVTHEDLADTKRLLTLHAEAVASGIIGPSENERLQLVAAAEHARTVGKENPCGLFAWLIRNRRFAFLTQKDEDRAAKRLKAEFFSGPRERGGDVPQAAPRPEVVLSTDARLVKAVRLGAQRAGYTNDPFLLLRRESAEWTRQRYDAAVRELERAELGRRMPSLPRVGDINLQVVFGASGGRSPW
jgi:hypothetical protein